jgi:hypothetical protein
MSRNERIGSQLGMSHGAATGRLRKMILFKFAQRLKEDTCFKCAKTIETVEELSIEHKEPWENRSAELFWDLNNVAFSHLKCNMPHIRRGGEPRRKIGSEGTAWCNVCKKFEPVESFYKHAERWNGLQQTCKLTRRDRV